MARISTYEYDANVTANDKLIGTDGDSYLATKNFSLMGVAEFIIDTLINPEATDFHVPVFNSNGTRLTDSIMHQDSSPSNGTAGTLLTVDGNFNIVGNTTLGTTVNDITTVPSTLKVRGKLLDQNDTTGLANQVLQSDANGYVFWGPEPSQAYLIGQGALHYLPLWTPDGGSLGNSLLRQDGDIDTPATTVLNAGNYSIAGTLAIGSILNDNSADKVLVIDSTTDIVKWRASSSIIPDLTGYQLRSEKGNANGYTPLDVNNKVPITHLPGAILGSVIYRGTWDATADSPTLPDPTTVQGDYYVVSNPGTYSNGITYALGDWVISNGTVWEKVDNNAGVSSVNGATGTVSLGLADLNDVAGGTTTGDVLTRNASGDYDFQTPAFQDIVSTCLGAAAPELNNTTNVFMIFDTTSGIFNDADNRTQMQGYAQQWMNDYTTNNPGYTGNLFMAKTSNERWLEYPSSIYNNYTSMVWIDTQPTPVERKDMFLVAFVNEVEGSTAKYHSSAPEQLFLNQPSSLYANHYNSFKADIDPTADRITFFKGLVYPVTSLNDFGTEIQFVLHAYAAIEGCDSATIDLANLQATTGPNYYSDWSTTMTSGVTTNPYNTYYSDMKTSGWSTILNRRQTEVDTIPFNVQAFNDDLNSVLGGDSTPGEDKVQVLKSFENGVVTLRGLKSSTLDLSVDDEGCIVIELRE